MNNTSPDAVFKSYSPGVKYLVKPKQGKTFENAIFVSSTYDTKEHKDYIEYGENKSSISNFLSKELITKLEESSPYRSIKSSKKFFTEPQLQSHQEDKLDLKVIRKNSDSSFETSTSNLLSFQIKDLEQRTKMNKISSLSNLQINECDEIEYDLRKEVSTIQILPSPDIVKQRTLIRSDQANINLGNTKSKGLNHSQTSGNNIINFNPIINNNIHYNTINLPNLSHNLINQSPQNNVESQNIPNSINHNTILENYFYHLRQLQGFQQIYLNQYCSSSVSGNNSTFNPLPKKQSQHFQAGNSNFSEKKNSDSTEEDSSITESTKTFMYGKHGWICHSCNNFNYESRAKCNRCFKLPKFKTKECENYTEQDKSRMKLIEREGDWICAKCKNLNFSFRLKCNRCQTNRS